MDTTDPAAAVQGERADLLQTLDLHRRFLVQTTRGLTEEQARQRTTVSTLSVGGLIKHVAAIEAQWADFIVRGAAAMSGDGSENSWASGFDLTDEETLDGALAAYREVAARTDALVTSLPDLDAAQARPSAPWFPPGATWSARRVLLHVLAETSQYAGHADIIREGIDGATTMG